MAKENVGGAQEKIHADRNSGKETIQRTKEIQKRQGPHMSGAGETRLGAWTTVGTGVGKKRFSHAPHLLPLKPILQIPTTPVNQTK
jgi:hypothetical protein